MSSTSSSRLQTIEQEPRSGARAEASVLWLHGLGATAHDFESVPPHLGLADDLAVRFVFPQAPSIPVTLNAGMVMPAWYDIRELDATGRDGDEAGIRRSEAQVRALIEREIERGVPANKIVVAGFSQGGALALQTALRFPQRLAGVMVLSAYLLLADRLEDEASEANRDVPIFQAHGTHDPVVQLSWARRSRDRLEAAGWRPESFEYRMAHQVCLEELEEIGRWLNRVLAS